MEHVKLKMPEKLLLVSVISTFLLGASLETVVLHPIHNQYVFFPILVYFSILNQTLRSKLNYD